jgi:hypothetical protein
VCSARYQGSKVGIAALWRRKGARTSFWHRLDALMAAKARFGVPSAEAAAQLAKFERSVAESEARDAHWQLMRGFVSPGRVVFLRPTPSHSNESCAATSPPCCCNAQRPDAPRNSACAVACACARAGLAAMLG